MAKPDCDDGWLKYAHELDAALAAGDFNKGPRFVLHEMFGQLYGPGKHRTARLSPTEIARRCGMSREQISRAIKELTDANILIKREDGGYAFIKDYESWKRDGKPRLTPQEVQYCRDAPARAFALGAGKVASARDETVTARDKIVTEARDETVTDEPMHRDETVTDSVTKLSRNSAPPKNPLVGERIKDSLSETKGEPEGRIPDRKPEPEPRPGLKGFGANSPEDVERVLKAAEDLYPLTAVRTMCQQWLTDRPARVVMQGLAAGKGKPKPIPYIQALMDDPAFGVARPSGNGNGRPARAVPFEPAIPAHPVHVAPADSKFRRLDATAMRERREKLREATPGDDKS